MREGGRLSAVIDLLNEFEESYPPLDRALRAYFIKRRYMGSKDRLAVTETIYAIIRSWHQLSWWVVRSGSFKKENARALIIAAEVLLRKQTLNQLRQVFTGEQYDPAKLSEAEEEMILELTGEKLDHPDQPPAVRLNCPDWVYKRVKDEELLAALNQEAPFDLRANPLKGSRDKVIKEFSRYGLAAKPIENTALGIRLLKRHKIDHLETFKKGQVEVQDAGSQRVVEEMDITPGQRVLDFCAGAGGKSLALAARMENKGQIYLIDTSESRLKRARVRLKRGGVHNYMIHTLKSEKDSWLKKHKQKFDAVLVDAPCSGSGTWRRNPEARLRYDEKDLKDLETQQAAILAAAALCVKPQGKLYYVTCSILQEENEEQTKQFLKTHEGWKKGKEKAFLPHRDNTDAFYLAEFLKTA